MVIARWEEFTGGPRKPSRENLHITLNHQGVLLMNKKAWETVGAPDHVVLLFDQLNNMIGIRPATAAEPHAFPVRGQHYSKIIYAGPFCMHYGLALDRTMMFNDIEHDDENVLRLMLKTATGVSRPKKRNSRH